MAVETVGSEGRAYLSARDFVGQIRQIPDIDATVKILYVKDRYNGPQVCFEYTYHGHIGRLLVMAEREFWAMYSTLFVDQQQ